MRRRHYRQDLSLFAPIQGPVSDNPPPPVKRIRAALCDDPKATRELWNVWCDLKEREGSKALRERGISRRRLSCNCALLSTPEYVVEFHTGPRPRGGFRRRYECGDELLANANSLLEAAEAIFPKTTDKRLRTEREDDLVRTTRDVAEGLRIIEAAPDQLLSLTQDDDAFCFIIPKGQRPQLSNSKETTLIGRSKDNPSLWLIEFDQSVLPNHRLCAELR